MSATTVRPSFAPGAGSGSDLRSGAPIESWGRWVVGLIAVGWLASIPLGFTRGLGFLTALGYILAMLGLARPAVGLLGIALVATLDAPARIFLMSEGGLLRYNTFNYWLLLVAVLACPVIWRRRDLPVRLLQLFVLLLGVELVVSTDLELGIQHFVNVLSTFGMLAYFTLGGARPDAWIWMGLTSGMAGAVGGLAYYAQVTKLPFANPNSLAYFPVTALFGLCLAFPFASNRPRQQLLLGLLGGLNVVWVFLTGSRGSLLVALICVLFMFLVTPGMSRRLTVLVTVAVLGLAASTQFTDLQDYALGRLTKLADANRSMSNRTSGRFDLALGGWYIFNDHPLGVGTGGFSDAWAQLGKREGLSGFESGEKFPAHAGWVKVLAENGAPGILLLGSFALSFGLIGLSSRDSRLRYIGLFTSIVLVLAWVSTEFQSKGLWFLAAGTATLLAHPAIRRRGRHLAPPT